MSDTSTLPGSRETTWQVWNIALFFLILIKLVLFQLTCHTCHTLREEFKTAKGFNSMSLVTGTGHGGQHHVFSYVINFPLTPWMRSMLHGLKHLFTFIESTRHRAWQNTKYHNSAYMAANTKALVDTSRATSFTMSCVILPQSMQLYWSSKL